MKTLSFPLELADRCVKCGLCLPHCPTYRLAQDEGESPRGRIALMQGLATGALQASPALSGHLDRCLGCRNCEPVCPANVPYGEILDAGRALLNTQTPQRNPVPRWIGLLIQPRLRRGLHWGLWFAQKLGLLRAASHLLGASSAGRLLRYLPPLSWPAHLSPALTKTSRGTIALFTGCVGDLAGQAALRDSVTVLQALGYTVTVPAGQACCGAIHLHAGHPAEALRLAKRNQTAFENTGTAVLGCDSGCVATLSEYAQSFGSGQAMPLPVQDVCAFVAANWDASLKLRPLKDKVALHLPCTQRNVLRSQAATLELLQRIPEIEVITLNTGGCCGAAGTYFLSQPEIAAKLAAPFVTASQDGGARRLLSGNIGCALHLRAQLPDAARIEVLHPISLIAQQLDN